MRVLRACSGVALMLVLAALAVMPAAAQQIEARIVGKLVDTSGAALPGVTVTVTSKQTGATRVAVSEAEGDFAVTNLAPGAYTVLVELAGFATETRDIVLGLAQVETLNLKMGVAGITEAVTVSASANVIDLSSAKIGVNVSPEEIQSLPVNGRNFANLMTLATGATTDGNGGWASVRFNGKSNQQNYLNYDGVDGTYVWDASPGYLNATGSQFRLQTSMESVAEFRVNSGLAPAESGLGAGGNITVVSKSGGNRFTGSIFEYFRNDALDAASKYDDKTQDLELNQFGGSLGGPLAANRSFFFVSYEGLKQTTGLSFTEAVPSDEAIRRVLAGDPVGIGRRAERHPHAGSGAAACRIPARDHRDRQPAALAGNARHAGEADRAQPRLPRRPSIQQLPVAVWPASVQRRRREHAGSHGDPAARPRVAAAAQLRRQPPVDFRRERGERAQDWIQPSEVRRHRVWAGRLRRDSGVAVWNGDLAVGRRARDDRRGPQRTARARHEQRVHQRSGLQPAFDLAGRRADDDARRPHHEGRR